MSFAKLLASGKSVIGGNGVIAYRENKRVYLPKFGLAKNPFAPAIQTELPNPAAENQPAKKMGAPVWAKTQKMATIPGTPKPAANWVSKLNPISMLLNSQNKTTAQNIPRPVQVELSLEKVKVVHNDLTDAEVEIVPMKSRPAREVSAPALSSAKHSWEALGERLLEVKVF